MIGYMTMKKHNKTNNLIYISGAKTGKADSIDHFLEARKLLLEHGYNVRLPRRVQVYISAPEMAAECWELQVVLEKVPKKEGTDYITPDLLDIMVCDSIYMLRDWEYDTLANREFGYALGLSKKIFFEEGEIK